MNPKGSFPAQTVLTNFTTVERMLSEFLEVIPYCQAHENVWAPKLATVLIESCRQLDSFWRACARLSAYTAPKPDITNFFEYFGPTVATRWVIFWFDKGHKIAPFDQWSKAASFKAGDYVTMDWWKAYNNVKHDALANQEEATLGRAIQAVGGLFLAIVKCPECAEAVWRADWLRGPDPHPAHLAEDSDDSDRLAYMTAESKLFTYAVFLGAQPDPRKYFWGGVASHRFRQWIEQQRSSTGDTVDFLSGPHD